MILDGQIFCINKIQMEKKEKSLNGKYVFGDMSTFGSSQNGQNMPKKSQQEKILFGTLNKGQLPTLIM